MKIKILGITSSNNEQETNLLHDNNIQTAWNSGSFPPVWIKMDLGYSQYISRIKILVNQYPQTIQTTHKIYFGDSNNEELLLKTINPTTIHGEWLIVDLNIHARYIKILTTQTSSWVSWKEIVLERDEIKKIKKRVLTDNVAEMYTFEDGNKITLTGNNYTRLSTNLEYGLHHSLFLSSWKSEDVLSDIISMRKYGYNFVRVIMDSHAINNELFCETGKKLSETYMANLYEFLSMVESQNMYVMFVLSYCPNNYISSSCENSSGSINPYYFCTSLMNNKKNYVRDFITDIDSKYGNLVFAYEIENEQFYDNQNEPLNTEGLFVAPNGVNYSLPSDKQQMMDASLVYWCNDLYVFIRSFSDKLIGVGFFNSIESPSVYSTRAYWAIQNYNLGGSLLDFIDIHIYPNPDFSTQIYLDAFSIPVQNDKIFFMGEIGIYKSRFPDIIEASEKVEECILFVKNYYKKIENICFWTWNTFEQVELWNSMDENGEINSRVHP